ncbi:MAG TPA: PsbP-related protein, partial [bacterium]|nr:PsbP-related protein [bacterium]
GQGQEPDVAMTRYRHPSGGFGIEYPQGWRVRAQSGGTTFYKDDPDEGTSFTVVAMQPAQGELKARQILQAVTTAARKQYPDLRAKPGALRNLGSPGAVAEMLEADAWWTNVRGRKMQAAILIIATTSPGAGFTSFTVLLGQAPVADFPAMRPIYQRMMQSMGPGT